MMPQEYPENVRFANVKNTSKSEVLRHVVFDKKKQVWYTKTNYAVIRRMNVKNGCLLGNKQ